MVLFKNVAAQSFTRIERIYESGKLLHDCRLSKMIGEKNYGKIFCNKVLSKRNYLIQSLGIMLYKETSKWSNSSRMFLDVKAESRIFLSQVFIDEGMAVVQHRRT